MTDYLQQYREVRWGDSFAANVGVDLLVITTTHELVHAESKRARLWSLRGVLIDPGPVATYVLSILTGIGSAQFQQMLVVVPGIIAIPDIPAHTLSVRLVVTPVGVGGISLAIGAAPTIPFEESDYVG
jgi:hypothetical protein